MTSEVQNEQVNKGDQVFVQQTDDVNCKVKPEQQGHGFCSRLYCSSSRPARLRDVQPCSPPHHPGVGTDTGGEVSGCQPGSMELSGVLTQAIITGSAHILCIFLVAQHSK